VFSVQCFSVCSRVKADPRVSAERRRRGRERGIPAGGHAQQRHGAVGPGESQPRPVGRKATLELRGAEWRQSSSVEPLRYCGGALSGIVSDREGGGGGTGGGVVKAVPRWRFGGGRGGPPPVS